MEVFKKLLWKFGSDRLATILGTIAGISQLHSFSLGGAMSGNPDDFFKLGGAIALIILGIVTNKNPTEKIPVRKIEDFSLDESDEIKVTRRDASSIDHELSEAEKTHLMKKLSPAEQSQIHRINEIFARNLRNYSKTIKDLTN
jgi:hypothetical protein